MILVVVVLSCGCGGEAAGPTPAALEPMQGRWVYDRDATEAELRERGVPDEQVRALEVIRTEVEAMGLSVYPDLDFVGNLAIGRGNLESEYRFFALHEHDGVVCGKAWHHEDRHDPGDMSKHFVRLQIVDDKLHFETFSRDEPIDLDDPDLDAEPVETSADACEVPDDVDWSITIYRR